MSSSNQRRCNYCGKTFSSIKAFSGHCRAHRGLPSQAQVVPRGKHGGYRPGVGRCLKGYVNGIFCDSTWEACVVLYFTDRGHRISRCTQSFDYSYAGSNHRYHPDFVVDGVLLEVKGYIRERDYVKWQSVRSLGHRLLVVDQTRFNRIILPRVIADYSDRIKDRHSLANAFDVITSKKFNQRQELKQHEIALANALGLSLSNLSSLKQLLSRNNQKLYELCSAHLQFISWLKNFKSTKTSCMADATTFAKSHGLESYKSLQSLSRRAFGLSLARLLVLDTRKRPLIKDYSWMGLSHKAMSHIVANSIEL